jgi:hypothetical protein
MQVAQSMTQEFDQSRPDAQKSTGIQMSDNHEMTGAGNVNHGKAQQQPQARTAGAGGR